MIQIHPIRGSFGFSYLATETRDTTTRAILIDACPGCTPRKLSALFGKLGIRPGDLCAIQLTHAHFDHCVNASAIQRWSGAPVYCPAADKPYLLECAHYRGLNKIGGVLETIGRFLWRYKPPIDVHYFAASQNPTPLPHLENIQSLALPGHTPGHTGYYIPSINTLIAGDLFAELGMVTQTPPRIFTDDRKEAIHSITKAAALNPTEVFICHTTRTNSLKRAKTLHKLATRHQA